MLPTGEKDKKTALQIILYTFWTILASVIPAFGFTGHLYLSIPAAIIVAALGIWMLFYAFKLYKLEKRINEIRQALKNEVPDEEELTLLLVEQVTLEKIKLQFTKELGRTILR